MRFARFARSFVVLLGLIGTRAILGARQF